jgi:hypothetical protein
MVAIGKKAPKDRRGQEVDARESASDRKPLKKF